MVFLSSVEWGLLLASGVALVALVASHWLPIIAWDVIYVCDAIILPFAVAGVVRTGRDLLRSRSRKSVQKDT